MFVEVYGDVGGELMVCLEGNVIRCLAVDDASFIFLV